MNGGLREAFNAGRDGEMTDFKDKNKQLKELVKTLSGRIHNQRVRIRQLEDIKSWHTDSRTPLKNRLISYKYFKLKKQYVEDVKHVCNAISQFMALSDDDEYYYCILCDAREVDGYDFNPDKFKHDDDCVTHVANRLLKEWDE